MAEFDTLVDQYLAETFARAPVNATYHGVQGHDSELPDLSAEAFDDEARWDDSWRDTFLAIDTATLTEEEQIDRELAIAVIDGRRARRPFEVWRRNPDTYLSPALMGIFAIFLRRPGTDAEIVSAAEARLQGVPELLDAGRANLDPELMAPILVERALGQSRAGARYARELVPAEVDDADQRSRLVAAGEIAGTAFDEFADHLESQRDQCEGDFALGSELYSRILVDAELLGYGVDELHRRGLAAYDELEGEMRELADEIEPGLGWRALVDKINQEHPDTPEAMRAGYETWTAAARAFLVDHDLVTFLDGEQCDVVPSPHFQRPTLAVASYTQPPSFGSSRVGRFNVPFPPEGTSDAEVRKRLSNNSWQAMPTISVHEAYPGHHWHLVTMMEARPLRRVQRSTFFTEGWGLYVEKMMREQGFFTDPRAELCHLDMRLFRAARIVVDTALHTGAMSFDEAVEFMHTKSTLSEPNARAEVGRYCSWPTQATSYLTGSLEIERLRERWFAEGRGSLKDFHNDAAATGALPIALAERALFGP